MTKSDDFFDITGAADPQPEPESATSASGRSVDFDVFGGAEAPAAPAADVTSEFTETLVAKPAQVMGGRGLEIEPGRDAATPAPSPAPVAATPAAEPAPAAAPAAAGGGRGWLIGAVLAAIAAAVWWLLK
ncbi:MAG: hypothetical protein AB7Q76_07665 [Gammaproteobacteria bacterium]